VEYIVASEKQEKEVSVMFLVIINFPPIKAGKDAEFQEWFKWSNKEVAKQKGFINRRLLKPIKGGNYTAVVEHESNETFMSMHTSPIHAEAGKRVAPLFDGHPTPQFYEVIAA
jgi:heme-degrading monooxygenase HmoA